MRIWGKNTFPPNIANISYSVTLTACSQTAVHCQNTKDYFLFDKNIQSQTFPHPSTFPPALCTLAVP